MNILVSQPIIESIFFKNSPLHDGAIIIDNNVVKATRVILPVNNEKNIPERFGLRHRAAIGITEKTSANYTRVQSILNNNSKINARLKNDTHFGSLTWNGKDYNSVQLEDIPRQAIIQIGDTIVTGGKSSIFPEGIPIGVIKNINIENNTNIINIQLFNDMSSIGYVYVITHLDKQEIKSLNE